VLQRASSSVVDLNLAGAGIDDAELAALGELPAVTHLRLARNSLTDAGLAALARAASLSVLNLYGNAGVSDAGLDALVDVATLREVFLWQTRVTAAGVARFKERRPDVVVQLGAAETLVL
jgi:hypothetical protein